MDFFIDINKYVSSFLNNFVLNNHLEKFIWMMADLPIFFLPIFLLWVWSYYTFVNKNIERKKNLLYIFYWVVLAVLINIIIQKLFPTQRPDTFIKPILDHVPDNSFPSDHAAVSFAFLTWMFLAKYKKTALIFSIFVIFMLFSRIAWWLHWFFDIIVWSLIWIFASFVIFKNTKNIYISTLTNFIIKIMAYFRF